MGEKIMNKVNWKEKLHYNIDNIFSKGSRIMIFWLLIVSIAIIMLFALIVVVFNITPTGKEASNFIESMWISLMHTLDASALGEGEGWAYRLFMLIVTLNGVIVISTLIGLISTGLETRLNSLQRGRSKVLEQNHIVILGWNENIFTIIEELCIANENKKDCCIVIMGNEDKISMEEQIREKIPNSGITRIVCRTGSPIDPASLDILSLIYAKSIIILSPDSDDPDSEVIKICLAIIHHTSRTSRPFHIVAELRQKENLYVGKIIGGEEVEWILSEDIIARMIAQTCHQSGLSTIYTDLMDYAGDEIYFFSHPNLIGKTFGELLSSFEKNAVMGIWKKDTQIKLNPPMLTKLEEGDQIIILAEDDDHIFFQDLNNVQIMEESIQDVVLETEEPKKTLILGWNSKTEMIIQEMDNYLYQSSEIHVVANKSFVESLPAWNNIKITNAKLSFEFGNTSDRKVLEGLILHNFNHIILLSYSDHLSYQAADAKTLITLLHLRDIANNCDKCHFSIVTEMLDVRNRNLAEVAEVDDFIISEKFISLLVSQISETKLLSDVFRDILNAEGSEVYLKQAQNYVSLGQKVNFYTIVESAQRKNEVAIGYKIGSDAHDPEKAYGIVLNPNKSQLLSFKKEDQIIVLAETFTMEIN
jgi:ion channel POLLUX/CASTOR